MASSASNRSPSPLSARNCRNSETNTTTRRSFSGNPFARPNPPVVNPRIVNPPTPANTPSTTDHMKRGSMLRKSTGSSMFEEGKENQKDMIRSPARSYEKGFMAPTISAASKFTPSPRKKVLSEKNEVVRTSIQFLDKDSILKPEATLLDHPTKDDSDESVTLEQKEVVLETPPVRKVTFDSINDAIDETVSEDFDFVKIRPFCCSPQASPIIAPLDADPLPPYDPKNNFLSPRPQFLRYKPNPRIELLLNKVDGGEDDVIGFEDGFNLSDNSSDTEKEEMKENDDDEEEEEAKEKVEDQEEEKKLEDEGYEPSDNMSAIVAEEKEPDSQLKTASKPRFFTRSKTILFISVMFLVACFSVSFTDNPPMDLPIYKDVSFSEIYDESSKLASSAIESFDGFVENLKKWSNNLVSYLSHQVSIFSSPQNSIQFFNLTPISIQEEWQIRADYEEVEIFEENQEFEEEMEEENYELIKEEEEEAYEEMEVDVEDEVLMEDPNEYIHSHDDDFLEKSLNLEDGSSEIASISASKSEMAVNDLEIESSLADTSVESETLTSSLTKSINPIFLAGFSMVIVAIAATFYMIKRKSSGKTATARVSKPDADNQKESQEESSCSSGTSVQKGYKKKTNNNKRDSLASSSEFSMGSASYGSFTTFEKIPIKKRDEAMLTPIRRSSRLVKSKVPSS